MRPGSTAANDNRSLLLLLCGLVSINTVLLWLLCLYFNTHVIWGMAAAPVTSRLHWMQPHAQQQLLNHLRARTAPVLQNYTISQAVPTAELCHHQANLTNIKSLSLGQLLQHFKLPSWTELRKQRIGRQKLNGLLQSVQANFTVVSDPIPFIADAMRDHLYDRRRFEQGESHVHSFPKLVHLTVRDKNRLQPQHVLAIASWAFHNPDYTLMLFDDTDMQQFIATFYPGILDLYDSLGTSVERADLWRYMVLCRLGGVYADSDVVAARPISQWVQDAGMLVGIENVFPTLQQAREQAYARQVQMVQWVIAARAGHPVACRMRQYVARHVTKERAGLIRHPTRNHAILERTGPGIWTDSVHDYLRQVANASINQLVVGGRVGDVRIVPQPVFGCSSADYNTANLMPYVYHMFMGSWKTEKSARNGTRVKNTKQLIMRLAQQKLAQQRLTHRQ